MSFTLNYAQISNPNFITGLRKIVQNDKFTDPKRAYNCARIGSLMDLELKTFHDLRFKFNKKWKEMRPENVESSTEADKQKLEELKVEADKFAEVSFEIPRHKVDFEDLAGIGLSPNEILALEPLLTNLPE